MAPKDRVERGAPGIDHVAGCGILNVRGLGGVAEIRIDAAGKVMDQVVDVLQGAEEMVIRRPAAEGEEVVELQNALDVLRPGIRLENNTAVAAGPALVVP